MYSVLNRSERSMYGLFEEIEKVTIVAKHNGGEVVELSEVKGNFIFSLSDKEVFYTPQFDVSTVHRSERFKNTSFDVVWNLSESGLWGVPQVVHL